MKRLMSILLAVAMIMAFAVPAMATETVDPDKIPEEYPLITAYAYNMTYYENGYGAVSNRYKCSVDFGYETEDGGILSWYEWYDISYGDPIVAEWPTEVGEYTVTFVQTATVYGTEYVFTVPMNITVLELPATSGQCGDNMTWSFDTTTDTLTISGTGDMYTIAETTDAYWNEQYGYEPGWWKLPVKHIVVEEGVENLSNFAFFQNWNTYYKIHETIQLPTTLKEIPELGFMCSTAMTSLAIPEGITSITGWPFGSPGNSFLALTELCLPSTLTEMDIMTVILSGLDPEAGGLTLQTIHFAGTEEQWNAINRVRSETMQSIMPVDDETYALYEEMFNGITVVFEPKEEVTVENGTATVPDSSVEITEGEDVVIDVTDTEEEVSSVVIGSETVDKIADAETSVEIKLPDATVFFDAAAIGSIGEQAGQTAVTIVAKEVEDTTLTTEQKAALEEKEVHTILNLEAYAGETKITEFGGGKVTVSVPFELPAGKAGTDYYVAYVAEDGTITAMPTTYADGVLTFETTHFSNYVVLENQTVTPADPSNPQTGDNSMLFLWVTVMLLSAAGLTVCLTKRRAF